MLCIHCVSVFSPAMWKASGIHCIQYILCLFTMRCVSSSDVEGSMCSLCECIVYSLCVLSRPAMWKVPCVRCVSVLSIHCVYCLVQRCGGVSCRGSS